MKAEPILRAFESVRRDGERDSTGFGDLAAGAAVRPGLRAGAKCYASIVVLCGRYKGIDER